MPRERQNQADNHRSPILRPGDCCPTVLATEAFLPFFSFTASVSGPLRGALDSVNAFLQFYFKIFETRRNLPFLRNDRAAEGFAIPNRRSPARAW
mgnify:FL=1